MKFLYLLLQSALSFASQSQNVKTSAITWNGASLLNFTTGDLAEGTSALKPQGTTSITWTKAYNTPIVFTVGEVSGHWNNVKKNGEIVSGLSSAQSRGTVTFSKEGNNR